MLTRFSILAALLLALATTGALAKRFYKYQDEDGIWHFTDRAPDTENAVESELIRVDDQDYVSVRRLGDRDAPIYQFTNSLAGPVTIALKFAIAENVIASPPLPAVLVLEAYESKPLVRMGPADDREAWRYQLRYRFAPGEALVEYDSGYLYSPPFGGNEPHLISQAFNGEFSHTDSQARHAVDIAVPEDTPIVAARGGIVMQVEDDYFGRGLDMEKYASRANSVRILHDDGTMAVYAHLKVDSAAVSLGQLVEPGALLALSGDTGFTNGPHLHFVIQRVSGGELETVPFKFGNANGQPIEPRRGLRLGASQLYAE